MTFSSFSEEQPRQRGSIVRQAVFYTSISALLGAVILIAVYNIIDGEGGFVVMLFFGLLFSFPFAYRAVEFLRDLGARPTAIEGEMLRKWAKANFLFFFLHGFYIVVEEDPVARVSGGQSALSAAGLDLDLKLKRKIYSVRRADYAGLLDGDRVRILRYPHSLTIETIERFDGSSKRYVAVFQPEEPYERRRRF